MEKKEKIINIAELVLKLMFMTVGMLLLCSLTYGLVIISIVQWPTVALGYLLVLYRLINLKHFTRQRGTWLLIGFIASFVLSMVLNFKYGWYSNFRALIFLVFEVALLFAFDARADVSVARHHLNVISVYFICCTALLSVLSFAFMIAGYSDIFVQEVGPTYQIGFVWGRLFGAYWDPNIGSMMAAVSAILSIAFFIKHKNIFVRIMLIANAVVQLCYIEFSDSRSGKVGLFVIVAVFVCLGIYKFISRFNGFVKAIVSALAGIVAAVFAVTVIMLVGAAYNAAVSTAPSTEGGSEVVENVESIGREEDIAEDVSNRRFDIWTSATEIFLTSPVYGTSHENIVPYAQENSPDTYIITNDHMVFSTMHNIFFDVLAGQGIIGIGFFLAAVITVAINIFKKTEALITGEHSVMYAAAYAIVIATVCSSMFMTELFYVITPLTLMFWSALGCLSKSASVKAE